eukprot:8922974-Pyramimonas_sp.AAC.1
MEWAHHGNGREVHHYCPQETWLLVGSSAPPISWARETRFTARAGAAMPMGDGALEHSGGAAMLSRSAVGPKRRVECFPERVRRRLVAQLAAVTSDVLISVVSAHQVANESLGPRGQDLLSILGEFIASSEWAVVVGGDWGVPVGELVASDWPG